MSLRPRAIVLAVITVALALGAFRLLSGTGRVLGWIAMAATLAAIATPLVDRLGRKMPRGIAVLFLALATLGATAGIGYGVVATALDQLDALQKSAPAAARQVERRGPFAEAAAEARVAERIGSFVEQIPLALQGGSAADIARSATTRGLALLAVTVLTIFLVLHGPKLLDGARRQLPSDRQPLAGRLTVAMQRRAFGYVRGAAALALAAGTVAYVIARLAGVTAPVPLAVWVALWDLVPIIGATVGALPIIALAAVASPAKGAVVAVSFLAYQILEERFFERPLEARTVRVGPFLTLAFGIAGIELYGLAGGLIGVVLAAVSATMLDEAQAARPQ